MLRKQPGLLERTGIDQFLNPLPRRQLSARALLFELLLAPAFHQAGAFLSEFLDTIFDGHYMNEMTAS
jgi:hypothetical protein